MDEFGEIIIYQTDDGLSKIEVNLKNETVWLSIDQMAELFQRDRSVIGKHVRNIFKEGELVKDSVWAKFAYTAADGKVYDVDFYNLDVIISVGYRVKSIRGTQFRIWANSVLKEYIIKGFAMDDDRLKGNGGGNYWKELLDRIRDIRSSEKVLYRQVLDLYATSVDYNPKSEESIKFFKIVQNKLHYAAHGHTAAERYGERTNEYRVFYINHEIATISRNSGQMDHAPEPPKELLGKYKNLNSPYYTVDYAELENGSWRIVEAGDGEVSGLSDNQDYEAYFRALYQCFKE